MNSILVNKAGALLFTLTLLILSFATAVTGSPVFGGWTSTAVLAVFNLLEAVDLRFTIRKIQRIREQA